MAGVTSEPSVIVVRSSKLQQISLPMVVFRRIVAGISCDDRVERWPTESDERGTLDRYFEPTLTGHERAVADLEDWIIGIM